MINPQLEEKCKSIAMKLLFTGIMNFTEELKQTGLSYRKDKNVHDVRKAMKRGVKKGNARVDHEISMTTLYLSEVLKLKKD
jgi:hypothetical protein